MPELRPIQRPVPSEREKAHVKLSFCQCQQGPTSKADSSTHNTKVMLALVGQEQGTQPSYAIPLPSGHDSIDYASVHIIMTVAASCGFAKADARHGAGPSRAPAWASRVPAAHGLPVRAFASGWDLKPDAKLADHKHDAKDELPTSPPLAPATPLKTWRFILRLTPTSEGSRIIFIY